MLLGAIDLTVIAAVLPAMIPDLGLNTADVDRYVWAVNGYLIAYIVAIPLFGRISDVLGRQRAFLASLLLFALGSLLCGRANGLDDLVVARSIQGFGGGGILPVAIALTGDSFGPRRQLTGVGIVGAVETAGWLIGLIYGASAMIAGDGADDAWRWVFWINIPLLLGALLLVRRYITDRPTPARARSSGSVDVVGAILLAIALVALCLAVASSGEVGIGARGGLRALGGTPNPLAEQVPALLALAASTIPLLIVWLRRASTPLLPVALFRQRPFVAALIGNLLAGSVLMVVMVNVPVVVTLAAPADSVSSGTALLLAPFTASLALASLAVARIHGRSGERRVGTAGIALAVAGCLALGLLLDGSRLWTLLPGLVLAGTGLGALLPSLISVPVGLAPVADRGATAATALMFRLLGMTLGTSALTSLGVRRLQELTGRLDPVTRGSGESTASFLERQRRFIEDHAVPLSVQVLGETFLATAGIAALVLIPLWLLHRRRQASDD